MIVGFDGISRSVILDVENGRPPLELPVERLLVKLYGQSGIFFVEALALDRLEVGFLPISEEPVAVVLVEQTGALSWRVRAAPLT